MTAQQAVVDLRLYRALMRTSKRFTSGRNAALLTSLLHRVGIDDHISWDSLSSSLSSNSGAETDIGSSGRNEKNEGMAYYIRLSTPPHVILFRRLLREVVTGEPEGTAMMKFPCQIDDTMRLKHVIRREFRSGEDSCSIRFDESTQRRTAFSGLREINKKLAWAESIRIEQEGESEAEANERYKRYRRQAARNVSRLPLDPKSYLQPGCFLVAHPHQDGFFAKSVIVLLDHTSGVTSGGTYGVVINKGSEQKLKDVLRYDSMPESLRDAFGDSIVREGGPVHFALQVLHRCTPEEAEEFKIGGNVLSMIQDDNESQADSDTQELKSTAIDTDQAIYFKGDITRAAEVVIGEKKARDDFSFFVGASCWSPGQLENEIKRGYWLPCRGPPSIALTGKCDHELLGVDDDEEHGELWLSMMSALGEDEAILAHCLASDDDFGPNSEPCDDFSSS